MEVILSHDFADFDAVAALVAARRLVPAAYPIKPARANGNVQRFLDDYGGGLGLVERRDVPEDKITRVFLVDTQQLPGWRRLPANVTVRVIDHHPPDANLDPSWDALIEEVGATVTLLVEQLQAGSIELPEVEATLLALGIFEDTGSLLYGVSTPRDARAVAWLMEQGANPDVARQYLHEPLDEAQRDLLAALQAGAEALDVAGHTVMLACADVPGLSSSIAPLANHLGDLWQTDVLLLLIGLKHHVQLVARSAVEEVDVGLLARELGGGGHRRAAAARLQDAGHAGVSSEAARQMVADVLREIARPAAKVADAMSHGVLTLGADTTAAEAARQIRRYGYEGYPVVEGGKLVGLLTRRAVDRAMNHDLSRIRLREIMAAGAVTVSPGDSLRYAQQVMLDSGWGQLPVVDDAGQIMGVVTRTDLIKDWKRGVGDEIPQPSPRELMRMLGDALPPPLMALVEHCGRAAGELGFSLYVVGGVVRDLLLKQPKADVDFVVEGDAIKLVRRLRKDLGGETRAHGRFGTAKWLLDEQVWRKLGADSLPDGLPATIDFATARTEFYAYPTALPEVERSSIKMDLHRRDFSINALALQLDAGHEGRLLDFWGGLRDLDEGVIRVLHSLSFIDDPTRMLRAVRLEQRLGFAIADRTRELIGVALPMLDRVSGDRIRHEFEAIFAEARPEDALARLDELGLMAEILPGVAVDGELSALMADLRAAVSQPLWPELANLPNLEVPYFALLTRHLGDAQAQRAGKRLKIQRRSADDLQAVRELAAGLPALEKLSRPSEIDALLRPYSDRALLVGWTLASPPARAHIETYARQWQHVHPLADGQALKALGLRPGPEFREVLGQLRAAWLDGDVSDAGQEDALLQALLAEHQRSESAGN